MRDGLSIVAALTLIAMTLFWIIRVRSHDRRREQTRNAGSTTSSQELRDRLGAGRASD